MLNTVIPGPEIESYCQFRHGTVCKRRYKNNGYYDAYALAGDRWAYDASLESMFEDLYEYDSLRYEIPDGQ